MTLPVGTIANVATVLVGTTIGVLAGGRIPERLRSTVLAALGLLTASIGIREVMVTGDFPIVLGAVLVGAVIGEGLRIEQGLETFGAFLQRRLVPDGPGTGPAPGSRRFSEGFVLASLLFCVGPLTIVGSIQDGLGDPELLFVKAGLDGFASIAFAAVYGWGVALAALTVAVVQGSIALLGGSLDGVLTDSMLDALASAGGVLLLGIALRLLDLKRVRVANLLPAIVLAPLFARIWAG
jgi:uncharacterized protein